MVARVVDVRLPDATAERVRASHAQAIKELQTAPLAGARTILGVELADATETPIPHGLGRPALVLVSPPRNPTSTGRIEEIRSSSYDRSQYVVLEASGWGVTIIVDLVVL